MWLSNSEPVIAAQLTATNGPVARGLFAWIARAISSLPVPLGPATSTLEAYGATRSICVRARWTQEETPTSVARATPSTVGEVTGSLALLVRGHGRRQANAGSRREMRGVSVSSFTERCKQIRSRFLVTDSRLRGELLDARGRARGSRGQIGRVSCVRSPSGRLVQHAAAEGSLDCVRSMMFDTAEARFAIAAVREAALLVRRVQAEMVTEALTKGDKSPVTVGDFAAQAVVGKRLGDGRAPRRVLRRAGR